MVITSETVPNRLTFTLNAIVISNPKSREKLTIVHIIHNLDHRNTMYCFEKLTDGGLHAHVNITWATIDLIDAIYDSVEDYT